MNGNPKKLKKSAAYTIEFGLSISNLIHPYGVPNPSPDPRLNVWFEFMALCFGVNPVIIYGRSPRTSALVREIRNHLMMMLWQI